MEIRSNPQWSGTTGLNLITDRITDDGKYHPAEGRKFRASGKSRTVPSEFTIVSLNPIKSGKTFTTIVAKTGAGVDVELMIPHNSRYQVPVNQR